MAREDGYADEDPRDYCDLVTELLSQFRKVTCHPYLFNRAVYVSVLHVPLCWYMSDLDYRNVACPIQQTNIFGNSGKMAIFDKLLASIKAKGSRVLIFS